MVVLSNGYPGSRYNFVRVPVALKKMTAIVVAVAAVVAVIVVVMVLEVLVYYAVVITSPIPLVAMLIIRIVVIMIFQAETIIDSSILSNSIIAKFHV